MSGSFDGFMLVVSFCSVIDDKLFLFANGCIFIMLDHYLFSFDLIHFIQDRRYLSLDQFFNSFLGCRMVVIGGTSLTTPMFPL